jgi:hypothetical protein
MSDATTTTAPVSTTDQATTSTAETAQPTPENTINWDMEVPVKIDGKEIKKSLKDVIRGYQIDQAGYAKLEAAAKEPKQAEEILRLVSENPREAFRRVGKDAIKYAEEILAEEIRRSQMSPEQIRIAELEAEVRRREAEDNERINKARMEEETTAAKQYRESLSQDILKALENKLLPKTPHSIAETANVMRLFLDKNVDISVDQAIEIAQNRFKKRATDIFENMSAQQILQMLPETVLNKIRKADLERISSNQFPQEKQISPLTQKKDNANRAPMPLKESMEDYFERRKKELGNS